MLLYSDKKKYKKINDTILHKLFEHLANNTIEFLILEPYKPFESSTYIQTAKDLDGIYLVEIRFEFENMPKQYQLKTTNLGIIENIFLDYSQHILPDISSKQWKDITKYVLYYYDIEKTGITIETSHPYFVEHFTHTFYYDTSNEFSPFGSDSGYDTLYYVEKYLQNDDSDTCDLMHFIRTIIEDYWGLIYISMNKKINLTNKNNNNLYLEICQSHMAVGFASIKITGGISTQLKENTIKALHNLKLYSNTSDSQQIDIMIEDLRSFNSY